MFNKDVKVKLIKSDMYSKQSGLKVGNTYVINDVKDRHILVDGAMYWIPEENFVKLQTQDYHPEWF